MCHKYQPDFNKKKSLRYSHRRATCPNENQRRRKLDWEMRAAWIQRGTVLNWRALCGVLWRGGINMAFTRCVRKISKKRWINFQFVKYLTHFTCHTRLGVWHVECGDIWGLWRICAWNCRTLRLWWNVHLTEEYYVQPSSALTSEILALASTFA